MPYDLDLYKKKAHENAAEPFHGNGRDICPHPPMAMWLILHSLLHNTSTYPTHYQAHTLGVVFCKKNLCQVVRVGQEKGVFTNNGRDTKWTSILTPHMFCLKSL